MFSILLVESKIRKCQYCTRNTNKWFGVSDSVDYRLLCWSEMSSQSHINDYSYSVYFKQYYSAKMNNYLAYYSAQIEYEQNIRYSPN